MPSLDSKWLTRVVVAVFILLPMLGVYGYRQANFNRELDYARNAFENGDYIGAKESYKLALAINNLPEIRGELRRTSETFLAVKEGDAFFETGDYAKASIYYRKVRDNNPADIKTATKLTVSQELAKLTNKVQQDQEQSDLLNKITHYQSIAKLDPNNTSATETTKNLINALSEQELEQEILDYYLILKPFLRHRYKPSLIKMSDLITEAPSTKDLPEVKLLKTELSNSQTVFMLNLPPELAQVNDLLLGSIKSLSQTVILLESSLSRNKPLPSNVAANLETAQLQLDQFIIRFNELLANHPVKGLEYINLNDIN